MIAFVKDIKYFDQVLGLGLGCADNHPFAKHNSKN